MPASPLPAGPPGWESAGRVAFHRMPPTMAAACRATQLPASTPGSHAGSIVPGTQQRDWHLPPEVSANRSRDQRFPYEGAIKTRGGLSLPAGTGPPRNSRTGSPENSSRASGTSDSGRPAPDGCRSSTIQHDEQTHRPAAARPAVAPAAQLLQLLMGPPGKIANDARIDGPGCADSQGDAQYAPRSAYQAVTCLVRAWTECSMVRRRSTVRFRKGAPTARPGQKLTGQLSSYSADGSCRRVGRNLGDHLLARVSAPQSRLPGRWRDGRSGGVAEPRVQVVEQRDRGVRVDRGALPQ
jgi:hypothetical protein